MCMLAGLSSCAQYGAAAAQRACSGSSTSRRMANQRRIGGDCSRWSAGGGRTGGDDQQLRMQSTLDGHRANPILRACANHMLKELLRPALNVGIKRRPSGRLACLHVKQNAFRREKLGEGRPRCQQLQRGADNTSLQSLWQVSKCRVPSISTQEEFSTNPTAGYSPRMTCSRRACSKKLCPSASKRAADAPVAGLRMLAAFEVKV